MLNVKEGNLLLPYKKVAFLVVSDIKAFTLGLKVSKLKQKESHIISDHIFVLEHTAHRVKPFLCVWTFNPKFTSFKAFYLLGLMNTYSLINVKS